MLGGSGKQVGMAKGNRKSVAYLRVTNRKRKEGLCLNRRRGYGQRRGGKPKKSSLCATGCTCASRISLLPTSFFLFVIIFETGLGYGALVHVP